MLLNCIIGWLAFNCAFVGLRLWVSDETQPNSGTNWLSAS